MGAPGGGKGYAGITKSVAIEFDTYENYSELDDPNGNHISVHSRGALANSAHHRFSLSCSGKMPSQMNDGAEHSVSISYHAEEAKLCVSLDNQIVLACKVNLFERIGGDAFLGFTAGTGGLTQTHRLLSWSLFRPHS